MRVNQSIAYLILSAGALMRTINLANSPSSQDKYSPYHESPIVSYKPDSKSAFAKHKFPLSSGRRRRPYIQFPDGTYKIL